MQIQSVVVGRTKVPLLDRLDEPATYSFQVRGSMRQQLVLACRHLRGQFLVGNGVVQPAGEVPAFEVVLECTWIEMPNRGAEVVHSACRGDDFSRRLAGSRTAALGAERRRHTCGGAARAQSGDLR